MNDRKGSPINRGDRLIDAFGGIWSVLFIGMDGKAHCMSPEGRRMQIETTRFIKISARQKAELPTAEARRKFYFGKMGWE